MSNVAGKILDGLNSFAGSLNVGDLTYGGKTILESNKAINKMGKFVMGEADTGIRGTLKGLSQGQKFGASLKGAYMNSIKDEAGNITESLNLKAIAGTYVGVAAAGRLATGGGLYRDSTGNPNIPVIPFV